ncbi:MAG: hypothetical protein JZU70_00050 [Chlorobium sp.]|nr:hypothetical protein [Chlorobium sp.]
MILKPVKRFHKKAGYTNINTLGMTGQLNNETSGEVNRGLNIQPSGRPDGARQGSVSLHVERVGWCMVFFQTTSPERRPPLANVVNAANAPFQKRKIIELQKFTLSFSLSSVTFKSISQVNGSSKK